MKNANLIKDYLHLLTEGVYCSFLRAMEATAYDFA